MSERTTKNRVAALASGGLDSGFMVAELAKSWTEVYPVYVRCGLFWEEAELRFLERFVAALGSQAIQPVQRLSLPMEEIYQGQWYARGERIPGYHQADEHWEIPGRNLILLAKTGVWCRLRGINDIAHGTLAGNPFADATPRFFSHMEQVLSQGLEQPFSILTPLASLRKPEIIRQAAGLPWELTLSCPDPVGDSHCGICGKCRERITAFAEAGIPDPTPYHRRLESRTFFN